MGSIILWAIGFVLWVLCSYGIWALFGYEVILIIHCIAICFWILLSKLKRVEAQLKKTEEILETISSRQEEDLS